MRVEFGSACRPMLRLVVACGQIPYGVQQPAVSAQVARLEADLAVRLFEIRRPSRLTPVGKTLYDFIAPFFAG